MTAPSSRPHYWLSIDLLTSRLLEKHFSGITGDDPPEYLDRYFVPDPSWAPGIEEWSLDHHVLSIALLRDGRNHSHSEHSTIIDKIFKLSDSVGVRVHSFLALNVLLTSDVIEYSFRFKVNTEYHI